MKHTFFWRKTHFFCGEREEIKENRHASYINVAGGDGVLAVFFWKFNGLMFGSPSSNISWSSPRCGSGSGPSGATRSVWSRSRRSGHFFLEVKRHDVFFQKKNQQEKTMKN